MIAYDFALNVAQSTKNDLNLVSRSVEGIKRIMDHTKKVSGKIYLGIQNMVIQRRLINKQDKEMIRQFIQQRKEQEGINEVLEEHHSIQGNILDTYGKINVALATLAQSYLVYKSVEAFVNYSDQLDATMTKGLKTFGFYTNVMKEYSAVQDRIAKGELFGAAEEYMDAAEMFAYKGIKFTKESQNLLNDMALFAGDTVTGSAQSIISAIDGSYEQLGNMLGVTERTMRMRFARYEGDTVQMKNAIMGFIKEQGQLVGAASRAPKTFADYFNQIKAFFALNFFKQIFGDSSDPDSFVSQVKATVEKVTQFLMKNGDIIKKIANGIGITLKFIWSIADSLINSILRRTQNGIDALQKFFAKYQERIAGMLLYFALIKDEVTSVVKMIIKAWMLFEAYVVASNVFRIMRAGWNWMSLSLFSFKGNLVKISTYIKGTLLGSLSQLLGSIRMINLALFANPVGLIVAAIALLLVGLYLVIKNWDKIRQKMKGVSNTTIFLISLFNPLVGWTMLLAKHWENFQRIFVATAKLVKYFSLLIFESAKKAFFKLTDFIKSSWDSMVSFFKSVGAVMAKVIDALFPEWLKDFGGYIWRSLKSVGSAIKNFFLDLMPDWLKNFDLSNALGKLATLLEGKANAMETSYKTQYGSDDDTPVVPIGNSPGTPVGGTPPAGRAVPLMPGVVQNSSTSSVMNEGGSSVVEKGAIQINLYGADTKDADKIANLVIEKLNRRQSSSYGTGG